MGTGEGEWSGKTCCSCVKEDKVAGARGWPVNRGIEIRGHSRRRGESRCLFVDGKKEKGIESEGGEGEGIKAGERGGIVRSRKHSRILVDCLACLIDLCSFSLHHQPFPLVDDYVASRKALALHRCNFIRSLLSAELRGIA